MLPPLGPPWSGLTRVARRVDVWPLLHALGGPLAAATAPPAAWLEAGLPLGLLPALGEPAWPWPGVHAGGRWWPPSLDLLPGGPAALAVEGDVTLLARPSVAVVGARHCTGYGREWAARLATAVVEAGGVVVSGLAPGIDAAAHEAADSATIAVLGQALDARLPAWQARLRERIVARGGLVVSEFAPGTHADRGTFPVRNRVVAGLARAVVVVEAAHQSGAKNTVAHALRYGREVLALPGPLGADASAGCLDLIEQGATVVRGPTTVIDACGLLPRRPERAEENLEARVLAALQAAATPDAVARQASLPLIEALAVLGSLELRGRVVRMPGRRYVATPR